MDQSSKTITHLTVVTRTKNRSLTSYDDSYKGMLNLRNSTLQVPTVKIRSKSATSYEDFQKEQPQSTYVFKNCTFKVKMTEAPKECSPAIMEKKCPCLKSNCRRIKKRAENSIISGNCSKWGGSPRFSSPLQSSTMVSSIGHSSIRNASTTLRPASASSTNASFGCLCRRKN